MNLIHIARKSLFNRKTTSLLSLISIALSVCLLLGIERLRTSAKASFESTISGVDLIVGARSGPVNLLLYSVFRIGNPTNNISYTTFETIQNKKDVAWTIPISLGDSHKGYRVIGTNQNYFEHYKYSGAKALDFSQGSTFNHLFDVVIGAEVARKLKYNVGDSITLSHGTDSVSFQEHEDKKFKISGILAATGTPVDQSLHVSLEAIEALHIDWQDGGPPQRGQETSEEAILQMQLKPQSLSAVFIKLNSRMAVFNIQRDINDYEKEAIMAILPGISLNDLWNTMNLAEKPLLVVSFMVLVVSLISMVIALLASLNERRREMAIFRSIGASKSFVFSLLVFESALIGAAGILLGYVLLYIGLFSFQPILQTKMGLSLGLFNIGSGDLYYISLVMIAAIFTGFIPAWMAYKKALADGLTVSS